MGEYGFDHDTGKVTYHYGDGFATDSGGNQYIEVGGGHVVDLGTNEVHYSPSESSGSYDYSTDISLWAYIGVGCAIFCVIYTLMIFNTDPKYLFHALATWLLAVYSFSQAKKY